MIPHLSQLFARMWVEEQVPSDWSLSVLLPLFKKGDKMECANYRGISLLDICLKIFESVLLQRFQHTCNLRMRENQAGFRPGRGCADQIFSLRVLLNERYEFHRPTLVVFTDFKTAFDSVSRNCLWQILLVNGTPIKLIAMFKAIYCATRSRVRVQGTDSAEFVIGSGVRQGAIASPVLFNCVVDWVMSRALQSCAESDIHIGLPVNSCSITDLDYADDIALLAENEVDMQFFVNKVAFFGAMVGLRISPTKSKVLSSCVALPSITVDGVPLLNVDKFCYLGSLITASGSAEDDIHIRIGRACSAFQQLSNMLFLRNDISIATKVRVYKASVRSVLLYGCESWPMTDALVSRVESCEMNCLRRALNINYTDHVTNAAVRLRCNMADTISSVMQCRRLTWLGHVLRMDVFRLPRTILLAKHPVDWKRPRGGTRLTWIRKIHAETKLLTNHVRHHAGSACDWSISGRLWLEYLGDLAACRPQWVGCVRSVISSLGGSHGTS